MDGNRKKELKEQYKLTKPEMGLFIIKSKSNKSCYIEGAQNLNAVMNSTRAKLSFGSYPVTLFQEIWNALGAENFTWEVLEELEYDKDESKTDYKDELKIMEMIWEEKLIKEGYEVYKRKSK